MDPELVILARGGDHDAFARLVAGSIGRLNAIARLILRDYAMAEDAVQDAFVDAWRSLPGLRDPERFQAWLTRLLIRSCQDTRRRARRRTIEMPLLSERRSERRRSSGDLRRRRPDRTWPQGADGRSAHGPRAHLLPRPTDRRGRVRPRHPDGDDEVPRAQGVFGAARRRSMRTNDRCPRPRSERHDRPSRRRAVPPRPVRSDGRSDRPGRSDRFRPQRDRRSAAAARVAGGAQELPDDYDSTVVRTTAFDARVGVADHPRVAGRDHRGRRRRRYVPATAGADRERAHRVRAVQRDVENTAIYLARAGRLNGIRRCSQAPVECPQLSPDGRRSLSHSPSWPSTGSDRQRLSCTHDGHDIRLLDMVAERTTARDRGVRATRIRSVAGIYWRERRTACDPVRLTDER